MADMQQVAAVRIGSQDRSQVAERLVGHYQAGRMSRDELELRLTQAARAHTDDELHRLTIDLPDVVGPPRMVSAPLQDFSGRPAASPLQVAFDIVVLLLTCAAAVCLVLLMIVVLGAHSAPGFAIVAGMAALGAFTVGAGGVHLLHRVFPGATRAARL